MFRDLVIALLLTLSAIISARSQSVSVTGSLLSVSADEKSVEDTKSDYVFAIRLYLQLRNPEDYPVIVIKPNNYFLDRKVEFFDSFDGSAVDAFSVKFKRQYPGGTILGGLSDGEPSKSVFVIIPAHGYYEWTDLFVTDCCYSTTVELLKDFRGEPLKNNQGKQAKRFSTPQSIRPYLRVEYHLSIKSEKNAPERLDSARERWSKFGRLLISPEGDFTIASDIIINKSPN